MHDVMAVQFGKSGRDTDTYLDGSTQRQRTVGKQAAERSTSVVGKHQDGSWPGDEEVDRLDDVRMTDALLELVLTM